MQRRGGQGLKGEQSKLFFKYLEILGYLKQLNPNVKFLLENVASMKNENKELITKYLKEKDPTTDVVMIDSALLSAQRRKRLYWHNFGVEITQPTDKGLVLKDILESGNAYQNKSDALTARYGSAIFHTIKQRTQVAEPIVPFVQKKYDEFYKENGYIPVKFNPYNKTEITDKSPTITAQASSQTKSCSVMMFEPVKEYVTEEKAHTIKAQYYKNGDANFLINGGFKATGVFVKEETNYKDQFKQTSEEPKENSKDTARIGNIGSNAQAHRVYSVRGKSVNLSSQSGGQGAKTGLYKIDLPDGDYTIRKLTPIECERLQTLPDNYTALGIDEQGKEVKISNSARYKAIGNGWTTDVISHILSFLPNELKNK